MTIISATRFRRAETMLIARFGTGYADVLCAIVALCADEPVCDEFCLDDISVALDNLAMRLGRDRLGTLGFLHATDASFHDAFDMRVFARWPASSEDLSGLRLGLTAQFVSMVHGLCIHPVSRPSRLPNGVAPDGGTQAWLGLVHSATLTRRSMPFLYRTAHSQGRIGEELSLVAQAMAQTIGEDMPGQDVVVFDGTERFNGVPVPAAAALLSALLTTDAAVIVMGFDLLVPNASPNHTDDSILIDDEEPVRMAEENARAMSVEGGQLSAMLPFMPLTILVAILADTKLSADDASCFVGAVGPFRRDRQTAIEAVKASATWPMSDNVASQVITLYPDHGQALKLLDSAALIASARSRPPGADEGREASSDPSIIADRAVDPKEFDGLLITLATSLKSYVAKQNGARLSKSVEPFFRELIVTEPSIDIIFDRASTLRKLGARIALVGEPGCGKSAAAAAICAAMGTECRDVRTSDVLAYRLGAMESRLSRIFRAARADDVVLVFDEADSMMSSRATAGSASYIVGLTNSLLVEFDSHPLPLILATNYPDRIDAALLRRCDLVVTVNPLPEALEQRAYQLMLGFDPPLSDGWRAIGGVSVSDYAQARRMAQLTGDDSPQAAALAVRQARDIRIGESKMKGRAGFL